MLLHDLSKRIAERLRINRDIKRLKQIDDHLLADMGIEREHIAARVSGGQRGEEAGRSDAAPRPAGAEQFANCAANGGLSNMEARIDNVGAVKVIESFDNAA